MAFHVRCPITSRTICYCTLGFPRELQNEKGLNGFSEEIATLKAFLDDPWLIKDVKKTVQVLVPKVDVTPPPQQVTVTPNAVVVDGGPEDASDEMLSAQSKREAMQKKAAAASLVAEDYARRFESGDAVGVVKDVDGEEQVPSNGKVMCRLCFSGENERSERARKMLSCNSCNKKYHRSCLKTWAHDRDLFHWTSWTCPSCRICEVCRRTGDPNKLMFCKRCDGAYHCYCQHPPHKNVSKGPYLCPKHTKCHSCASTVPGNGSSLRWFLGYTCCDACGRLFVKGNYCPVCLKVYRDSESTPMVCCDVCQRWVHCHCDGISDERYLQFQVDNHLQYSCATCRGECYQVRDLEDAIQELWRRRDKADQDLITNLRAAAGLPTQDEIFAISPFYSDEDDDYNIQPPPPLKKEYGHSLKFSLKGITDNKKNKESSAKKSSKKQHGKDLKGHTDAQSIGSINKDQDVQSYHRNIEPELHKNKLVNEVSGTDFRLFKDKKIKNSPSVDETAVKSKDMKGRKLVIHLGARHKSAVNSPRSDASNSLLDQPLTAPPTGGEDMVQQRPKGSYLDMLANSSKLSDVEGNNLNHDDQTRISKRSTNRSVTPGSGSEKHKPSLRLKFKNPYSDDQSLVKGQRSKRKRPLTFTDKSSSLFKEEDNNNNNNNNNNNKVGGTGNSYDEIMDAKWIIQKLGKHAVGKTVEVHQQSSNIWHKGTIIEFFEDTSTVLVTLDDGKAMNVDLGKQGIRFVSKKQRQ